MKSYVRLLSGILLPVTIFVLIIDVEIALMGGREGIMLCASTVVPSLFPFVFLISWMTPTVLGLNTAFLRPLGRICGIPSGCEPIFLLGLLGGYPVGAQMITRVWASGKLTRRQAHRMLGYCNNAGPAFIFGICGMLFEQPFIPWVIWFILIMSAVIVGILLPQKEQQTGAAMITDSISPVQALTQSVKTMAIICGWIILFRILITFLDRWFLWYLPKIPAILLKGCLELSNGCTLLAQIESEAVRFVGAVGLLSFGGFCVGLQTLSITEKCGSGWYIVGKVLQVLISVTMALMVLPFLYNIKAHGFLYMAQIGLGVALIAAVWLIFTQNNSSISAKNIV